MTSLPPRTGGSTSRRYLDAVAYLDDHVDLEALASGRFDPPTLDRMRRLCELMADPQHAQPTVHITGTNGKGSTARLVSALLAANGLSTGTYTSPDLERVNERLSRDGEPIDDESFGEIVGGIADLEMLSGVRPTRFEILTLAAFRWFAELPVDVAVVEVGMGGRWDATNVADATVAVVTNVGMDHARVLGPTRADIAGEKAGIVKAGSILVLGEIDPDLLPVFEEREPAQLWLRGRDFECEANELAVGGRLLHLRTPGAEYAEVLLPLHGAHQGENAAVALAAAEALVGRPLADDVVREAFTAAPATIRGRFEVMQRQPLVMLDGAHNLEGARAAAATIEDFSAGELILVVGMNRDRQPAEMLEALGARRARMVVATAADWPRALPAQEIAEAARGMGMQAEAAGAVPAAVDRALAEAAPEDVVLVTGSIYVVGEARTHLRA